MSTPKADRGPRAQVERLGRTVVNGVEELGFGAALLAESLFWLVGGRLLRQPVRLAAVVGQMMEVGVRALPITILLSMTIGIMLAIQGIYTLRMFGAESKVVMGIAFSMVREFAPLIIALLVAGRSGSALAARLATMTINQEVDALRVMAIDPTRYLLVPVLLAMVVMVPCLTFFAMLVGLYASALYCQLELGLSLPAFADQTLAVVRLADLLHGVGKSAIFAVIITLVGAVNGASIRGGADAVGWVTTRAVVHSLSAIVLTDMIFAFLTTR